MSSGKTNVSNPKVESSSHDLSERLEKISLGLRRLRTGEERPEIVEYRNMGNGHFTVVPKGRTDKGTTD
jgi:hypothetical protein